ncbi:S1 domain-containing protein [Pseudomonas massiliensis]|uniref:hypothetical protein n=1 Tax=Pseudomonas massiliensis TaxID=522492 RepID=UPI00058BCF66|nr:hypothetical protein [Pseudomonas massiliensis]
MDTMIEKSSGTRIFAEQPTLGELKWFGGHNKQTGRENDYGFIAGPNGDVYFQQSQVLSPLEFLLPGSKVLFCHMESRKGKPAAGSVQVVSQIPDAELIALLPAFASVPQDLLSVLLCRTTLSPCENEALGAVAALAATAIAPDVLEKFWSRFPPAGPSDLLFHHAPASVQAQVYRRYYRNFREQLHTLFSSVTVMKTSLKAEEVYPELDQADENIAQHWAGERENDALLAKMLSARGAERAAKKFYESAGCHVEDISIKQLGGSSDDWITHDLLVDSSISIDVKNARRPVNGQRFYVEHTVARFKLDRKDKQVRIAGILSPYLSLNYVRKPGNASFRVGNLIFLGETSRESMGQLADLFGTSTFEVTRDYERTVPNWVFSYPQTWYRALRQAVSRFTLECEWPVEQAWEHVLNESERTTAIPALCLAGKPLPAILSSSLRGWQQGFYARLQQLLRGTPSLPMVFLGVLTDFLEQLKNHTPDFSPDDYFPLLFAKDMSYPVGAIDPLGLVRGLIGTLSILWNNREATDLNALSSFRFSGLGLLQGREKNRTSWKTIVAYCGGMAYQMDSDGHVMLDADGAPVQTKGKCGNAPLIIGVAANCMTCGKLVCSLCGFCSLDCQKRGFARRAKEARSTRPNRSAALLGSRYSEVGTPPRWEDIPLEAYANDFDKKPFKGIS